MMIDNNLLFEVIQESVSDSICFIYTCLNGPVSGFELIKNSHCLYQVVIRVEILLILRIVSFLIIKSITHSGDHALKLVDSEGLLEYSHLL